ncbi:MAG: DeoR family transcriptional regulator, fructose operon transcriptional repressor, partial [Thermotogota bacterium]|nr:DeoR family transcriptional regulator, fructose operon transcriptional repressor [Thermotogota bacterium]
LLKVSQVTIRKDLDVLEQDGELLRTHGGAILPTHSKSEWNFIRKIHQMENEKRAIAAKAVTFIEDGDTVIVDSSSTNYYLALEIAKRDWKHLTVVTNNVFIAEKLMEGHVEVLVLGGVVRENSLSLVGPWALQFLEEIHVDKAFLGTTGVSREKGFMTPNLVEAEVKRQMVKSASKVIIVTDWTKFRRQAFASFALIEEVDMVITDRGIDPSCEEMLLEKGVRVEKV